MNFELTSVEKTLFIPLLGKANDCKKKSSILSDKKANEIIATVNYDFSSAKENGFADSMASLRAKIIDNLVKEIIKPNKENVVLHLGCGLDSRYNRIGIENIYWYDIDFKEVIDIRKKYFKETEYYRLIASSILEKNWLKMIPKGKDNYIVIAEGVFQYIEVEKIKELLQNLRENIGEYYLIFDAMGKAAIKKLKNDKFVKEENIDIHFAMDHETELLTWDSGIKFIKKQYFTFNGIKGGNIFVKAILRVMYFLPFVKRLYKILVYRVGSKDKNLLV
jgi:O-methyltransferase involved in polyketide biosynthesis